MTASIRVDSVRKVFDDGSHNAFTDLCRFKGRYYLTFRSCPDGHMVFSTSRIVVMASDDTREWSEVHRFGVPGRDVRDPHFLAHKDTLYVYTGTWLATPGEAERLELNDHRGYGAWSTDGKRWEGPRFLEGTQGYYVWRAAAFGRYGYLNGRRKKEFAVLAHREREWEIQESLLLRTSDGLRFERVAAFQEAYGDETAFLFGEDGSIVAVVRNRDGNGPAFLCRSRPPYAEWSRKALDRNVGGPLLADWDGRLLVGGRRSAAGSGPVTVLSWLVDDALVDAAELPSGGDTSYPGFVSLGSTRGLVSWYSSHEGSGTSLAPCSIYMADVSV